MKERDTIPILCRLTSAELREREATLLAQFRSAVVETEELQEGYAFRLSGDGKLIGLISELIVAERECYPFLTVEAVALPNKEPAIVRVTATMPQISTPESERPPLPCARFSSARDTTLPPSP